MERRFRGKTRLEMNEILDLMYMLKDRLLLTEEELADYNIAMRCVATITVRMADNKPLEWDSADS